MCDTHMYTNTHAHVLTNPHMCMHTYAHTCVLQGNAHVMYTLRTHAAYMIGPTYHSFNLSFPFSFPVKCSTTGFNTSSSSSLCLPTSYTPGVQSSDRSVVVTLTLLHSHPPSGADCLEPFSEWAWCFFANVVHHSYLGTCSLILNVAHPRESELPPMSG